MRRSGTFIAASVFVVIVVGMFAGSRFAQSRYAVYAACGPYQRGIEAPDLPDVVD